MRVAAWKHRYWRSFLLVMVHKEVNCKTWLLQHHIFHILVTHCKINFLKMRIFVMVTHTSLISSGVTGAACGLSPYGNQTPSRWLRCLSHTVVRGSHVDVRDAGIRVSHEGFDGGSRPFPAVTPRWVATPSCSAPVKSHLLLLHSPQITFTVLWIWIRSGKYIYVHEHMFSISDSLKYADDAQIYISTSHTSSRIMHLSNQHLDVPEK